MYGEEKREEASRQTGEWEQALVEAAAEALCRRVRESEERPGESGGAGKEPSCG